VVVQAEFTGPIWYWRGPAPFHFVTLPDEHSAAVRAIAPAVTYGWGMVPVVARIGRTTFETAMFRQDELYVVPLKPAVRRAEKLDVDDTVTVHLTISAR
jgi:hypothetical protein